MIVAHGRRDIRRGATREGIVALRNYGVLKGKAIEVRLGAGQSPHYQVRLVDDTTDYRIAVNVKSQLSPSDVEFLIIEHFQHPITPIVEQLPKGFTPLERKPGSGALDFIRGNLFDRATMRPLPFSLPGFDNDLNEKLDRVMQRAVADEDALVYAFGERWGPEPGTKDKYFGFLPGNGIHDIHMNQGNAGQFAADDGVFQDGGVLVHFPDQQEWTAIFLKFQSQSWHTDDKTGHTVTGPVPPLPPGPPQPPDPPTSTDPDGLIRIVAALVNPTAVAGGGDCHAPEHGSTRRQPVGMGAARYSEKATAPLGGVERGCHSSRARQPAVRSIKPGRPHHAGG